jgi:uncharacterized RDD family membrane protein YckC
MTTNATFKDPAPAGPELEYVGFWWRVWASMIDTALSLVILVPILRAYEGADYWGSFYSGTGLIGELFEWVLFPIAVVIFWVTRQATPGKMAISATIVDADTGRRPTTGQFIGRYLAYYVSLLGFGLGFIWVGIDARKQGWHDKLAGTVVVRPRRAAPAVQFRST